jgi:hypothetical protein
LELQLATKQQPEVVPLVNAKEIVVEKTMEPQETSMVRSGNERSQSQSFTKTTFQSMDLAKSPP